MTLKIPSVDLSHFAELPIREMDRSRSGLPKYRVLACEVDLKNEGKMAACGKTIHKLYTTQINQSLTSSQIDINRVEDRHYVQIARSFFSDLAVFCQKEMDSVFFSQDLSTIYFIVEVVKDKFSFSRSSESASP